jgi:glyoxylate/hydroxypyruvate reductase A
MMSEFAAYAVLGFHRYMPAFHADQRNKVWGRRWPQYTPETHIGVLGIGAIGTDVAQKLQTLGFQVHGWSRTEKYLDGVICHAGESGLFEMLPQCQQIVSVLPLTTETKGIINNRTIAALPQGAYITNIGRGSLVVDEDLLAALESGHIAGAFLDVFNEEPLPTEHSYWDHPNVIITPHIAGEIVPQSCAHSIATNIRRYRSGEQVQGIADLERGY